RLLRGHEQPEALRRLSRRIARPRRLEGAPSARAKTPRRHFRRPETEINNYCLRPNPKSPGTNREEHADLQLLRTRASKVWDLSSAARILQHHFQVRAITRSRRGRAHQAQQRAVPRIS